MILMCRGVGIDFQAAMVRADMAWVFIKYCRDYVQHVDQIAAIDFPATPDTPDTPNRAKAIHHEPGLFLHMLSQTDNGPDIARLATIPHGETLPPIPIEDRRGILPD